MSSRRGISSAGKLRPWSSNRYRPALAAGGRFEIGQRQRLAPGRLQPVHRRLDAEPQAARLIAAEGEVQRAAQTLPLERLLHAVDLGDRGDRRGALDGDLRGAAAQLLQT